MDNLLERLASHSIIGLDTSVFIYHFEQHPIYEKITFDLLTDVERGQWQAVTSVITLMEITVRPIMMERIEAARQYEALLVNFPNLEVVEIDRDVARNAARLRVEYHVRPADALQVAGCLQRGSTTFITNDKQLNRLSGVIQMLVLDDFISA